MATDNPVAAEMRLYALELMVASLLAGMHRETENPGASLAETRRQFIEKTRQNPFRGLDSAMSDLHSAELEEAFERLLRIQASLLGIALPKDHS